MGHKFMLLKMIFDHKVNSSVPSVVVNLYGQEHLCSVAERVNGAFLRRPRVITIA